MFEVNDLIELTCNVRRYPKGWRGYVCGYLSAERDYIVLRSVDDKCVVGGATHWIPPEHCTLVSPASVEFNFRR